MGPWRADQPLWPGPPTPSHLNLYRGGVGGALSLRGSKGERPERARGKCFSIGHDCTLSLHGGDNIVIHLPKATLYLQLLQEKRLQCCWGPKGKKEGNRS